MRGHHPDQRRGRPPSAQVSRPDLPFTLRLPDGRTVYIEVPGRWTVAARGGEIGFLPEGVRFLDRVRALATSLDHPPSPGYVTTLRESMNLTQAEMGAKLGVSTMTVSRWERGTLRPSAKSLKGLERLRREAVRKGVVLPA